MQDNIQIFDPSVMVSSFPYILSKLPVTLELTVVSVVAGLLIGFLLALVKINKTPILAQVCAFFVSFMRGTPQLVQLFLVYYGLPLVMKEVNMAWGTDINLNKIPALVYAFVAFSLNEAAYFSETIRSAILSVDVKEIEAAKSVGMTGTQTMLRITLPEAITVAIPNIGNSIISLLKGTSLAFTITIMDVMGAAKAVAGSNLRYFEVYIVVSSIYWVCCLIIEQLVKLIEKKTSVLERKVPDYVKS
jgi:polar amino acid transport system permease protein